MNVVWRENITFLSRIIKRNRQQSLKNKQWSKFSFNMEECKELPLSTKYNKECINLIWKYKEIYKTWRQGVECHICCIKTTKLRNKTRILAFWAHFILVVQSNKFMQSILQWGFCNKFPAQWFRPNEVV